LGDKWEEDWKNFDCVNLDSAPEDNIFKKILNDNMVKTLKKWMGVKEEEEERNDIFIYKTLKYPLKSTPPKLD